MIPKYIKESSGNHEKPYVLQDHITYYSRRYDKTVDVVAGTRSDGATGAFDIRSYSWWVHDQLCNTGMFSDGSRCNNLQASMIIYDILKSEGKWFRARSWAVMTWLHGGGKARDNGMW